HHACPLHDDGAPMSARLKNRIMREVDLRRERRALRASRVIVANSEKTRRELIEHVGVDPRRVHVVYLGVDSNRFGPISPTERDTARRALRISDARPVVLFVGALGHERKKGFDTLLAAWRRL